VTNNLVRRISEHRDGTASSFTGKYGVKVLVYYETFTEIDAAIHRESRLKKYKREWKLRLIESVNPEWRDLCETL
jgi:putative endonuclease